MKTTILQCTYRQEPHFDWLCDSLARQSASLEDAELVVVDGMLWHDGAERRRDTLRRAALPFVRRVGRAHDECVQHLAPKPSRWQGPHRMTRSDFYGLANARNTGLIVARGEWVAIADDCSVLHERWLERHRYWHERGHGVAGAFFTYRTARVEDGRIVEGDPGPYGLDPRAVQFPVPILAIQGWGYGLNTSFRLTTAVEIGGWDEMYDAYAGNDDCDFGIRAERAGLSYMFDPDCLAYQILADHEEVCGHAGWGEKPPRKQKEVILRHDGKPHYCGEGLIERLRLDDPTRTRPLADWYDLAEQRRIYGETGRIVQERLGPTTHWVDGQPLAEME